MVMVICAVVCVVGITAMFVILARWDRRRPAKFVPIPDRWRVGL